MKIVGLSIEITSEVFSRFYKEKGILDKNRIFLN